MTAEEYANQYYDSHNPLHEMLKDAYTDGTNSILESEEYRQLVHEARLWRRQVEINKNR